MSTCRKLSLEVYARCLIVIVCTILTYLASTVAASADSNGTTPPSPDVLPPSQEITNEGDCDCYIVAWGDTLRGIAARLLGNEARWPALFAANRNMVRLPDGWVLTDPDFLFPGLQLHLPEGASAAPAMMPTTTSSGLLLSVSPVGIGQAGSQGSGNSNVLASIIPESKVAQPHIELVMELPSDGVVYGTTVEILYHITGMKSIHLPLPLTGAGKLPEINQRSDGYLLYQLDLQPQAIQYIDKPIKRTNIPIREHTLLVGLETDDHAALSPPIVQQIRFRMIPAGLPNTGGGGVRNDWTVVPASGSSEVLLSINSMGIGQVGSQGSEGFSVLTSIILEPRMGYAAQDVSPMDLYTTGSRDPFLLSKILDSPLPAWPLLPWISVTTLGLVTVPRQRKQIVLNPSTEAECRGCVHSRAFPSACDDAIDHGKNVEAPKQVISVIPKQADGDGAVQAQAEFVSMVLHELTNQLVIVHQHTTLLTSYSRQLTNEQRETSLRTIHEKSSQLIQLVHDLSDVSKVESGILDYNKQRCDFTDLVLYVCQQYQIVSPLHSLVWQLEKDVQVFGDPMRMEQVLVNLLANAVKYSPHGGEITVRLTTSTNSREACFSVADHGIGLAADELPLLFQRFSRVRNEHTATIDGTGLGLYICAKILEAHGGNYHVQSSPSRGTTVTCTLPLAAHTPHPKKGVSVGINNS